MSELVINSATMSCCGASQAGCSCHRPTQNATDDTASATQQAAAASLKLEHPPSISHGMSALQCSNDDDSEGAAASHNKAARAHERAATQARMDGDDTEAGQHDRAAALHRKAASMHSATITENAMDHDEDLLVPPTLTDLLANERATATGLHSFDGGTGHGTGAYSTDSEYGAAPSVRKSDQRGKTVPQPELDEDGDLLPLPTTFDGRQLATVKRQKGGADQDELEAENQRRLSLNYNREVIANAADHEDFLDLPRIKW